MTILSSDHGRIMVGLSSNRLYIGGSNSPKHPLLKKINISIEF